MKMAVFWDAALCTEVGYRRFGGACYLHRQVDDNLYQTTQRNNTEYRYLHTCTHDSEISL